VKLAATALLAATLFLMAALFGVGSSPFAPHSQPQSILVAGGPVSPTTTASPLVTSSPPTLPSAGPTTQAVGRDLQSIPIEPIPSPAGGSRGTSSPGVLAVGTPAVSPTTVASGTFPGGLTLPANGLSSPSGPSTLSELPSPSPGVPTSTATTPVPLLKRILGGLNSTPTPTPSH
jgi:hypothetical protein